MPPRAAYEKMIPKIIYMSHIPQSKFIPKRVTDLRCYFLKTCIRIHDPPPKGQNRHVLDGPCYLLLIGLLKLKMYICVYLFILNEWMVEFLYFHSVRTYVVVIHFFLAALLDEKRKFSPSTFVDSFPFGTVACRWIH